MCAMMQKLRVSSIPMKAALCWAAAKRSTSGERTRRRVLAIAPGDRELSNWQPMRLPYNLDRHHAEVDSYISRPGAPHGFRLRGNRANYTPGKHDRGALDARALAILDSRF